MKKFMLALTAMLMITFSAKAMSYQQAKEQALFLTDKMAYELNLTDDQYEAAYEINLDYLMSINGYDDLYGTYWRQRNLDLSYVLLDWQYNQYLAATYFYRPLYWDGGYWHFGIYARYPHRNFYYFGCPRFVNVYVGGHSWYRNGGRSWYRGRNWGPRPDRRGRYAGMRDGFKRGDYGRGQVFGNGQFGNRSYNNNRTVNNNRNSNNSVQSNRRGSFGNGSFGSRSNSSINQRSNSKGSFGSRTPSTVTRPSTRSIESGSSNTRGNVFGGHSSGNTNRQFSTPSRSNSGSFSTPSRSSGSFSTPSRSNSGSFSAPSRSSSSFGGGSRSFGGGSSNGGGHFGGHR